MLPSDNGTVSVRIVAPARKRNGIGEKKPYRPKAKRYRWDFSLAAVSGSVSVEFPLFAASPFSYRPGGDANNGTGLQDNLHFFTIFPSFWGKIPQTYRLRQKFCTRHAEISQNDRRIPNGDGLGENFPIPGKRYG